MQPSMTVRELQKGKRAEWFLERIPGDWQKPTESVKDKPGDGIFKRETGDNEKRY